MKSEDCCGAHLRRMGSRSPIRGGAFLVALVALIILARQQDIFAQQQGTFSPANRARALLAHDYPDSALKIVIKALDTDSLNTELWIVKAEIHSRQRNRALELASLRKALIISPDRLQIHEQLAEVYCDSGLIDSAGKYLTLPLTADSLNPRVSYYWGRVCELRGQLDSAAAIYMRTFDLLHSDELIRIPICPGYRIRSTFLRTTAGGTIPFNPGRPTLILFWATWSPESMKALNVIVQQLPKAGISWSFLPVNVDEKPWRRTTRQRVEAKARELGFKDPVPVDSGLVFIDQLELVTIPTLIATDLAYNVEDVVPGWNSQTANNVSKLLFGGGDSASSKAPRARTDCERALLLLGTAWQRWEDANIFGALDQVGRVTRVCSTAVYPRALSAIWRWAWPDTLRAGREAYEALRADSTDPLGWSVVAEVERRRNHPDAADQAVRRALQLDSTSSVGWVVAGRVAATAGDTTRLRQCVLALERVNRIHPGLGVLRALLKHKTGALPEAITLWRGLLDPLI